MATLHVRNVPEPVYELLRECAEQEGRSIGAQAIMFIQQALMPRAAQRALPRRRRGMQRFTAGAREAVVRAQDEVRALGGDAVLPGHILLGLLAVEGPAHDALVELGVTADAIRAELPRGERSPGRIPFSDDAKAALEGALRESLKLRHDFIGGEHLLLALRDHPALAGLDVHAVAAAPFARPVPPFLRESFPEYLAVDLGGDADAWTARLNELAAEGWELMQLLDHRAVFRRT